jgi:DNA-binding LytR/AlgR family response regulator
VTDFYLSDGTKVTGKKNLGQYRHSLEGKSSVFHMVHRSYVINENYLHRLESEQVILTMGNRLQEVPISRNMGRKFKEYLNLRG